MGVILDHWLLIVVLWAAQYVIVGTVFLAKRRRRLVATPTHETDRNNARMRRRHQRRLTVFRFASASLALILAAVAYFMS